MQNSNQEQEQCDVSDSEENNNHNNNIINLPLPEMETGGVSEGSAAGSTSGTTTTSRFTTTTTTFFRNYPVLSLTICVMIVEFLVFIMFAAIGWPGVDDNEEGGCGASSEICFCETIVRDEQMPVEIKQRANTWSNIAFYGAAIVIALCVDFKQPAFYYNNRNKNKHNYNLMADFTFLPASYACVLVTLGTGSLMYHSSLKRWTGLVDVLGLYYFATWLLVFSIAKVFNNRAIIISQRTADEERQQQPTTKASITAEISMVDGEDVVGGDAISDDNNICTSNITTSSVTPANNADADAVIILNKQRRNIAITDLACYITIMLIVTVVSITLMQTGVINGIPSGAFDIILFVTMGIEGISSTWFWFKKQRTAAFWILLVCIALYMILLFVVWGISRNGDNSFCGSNPNALFQAHVLFHVVAAFISFLIFFYGLSERPYKNNNRKTNKDPPDNPDEIPLPAGNCTNDETVPPPEVTKRVREQQ